MDLSFFLKGSFKEFLKTIIWEFSSGLSEKTIFSYISRVIVANKKNDTPYKFQHGWLGDGS